MNIATQTGSPEPEKKTPAKKKASPKKKAPARKAATTESQASGRKEENKNIRHPVGAETSPHKLSENDQVKSLLGKHKKHDWDHYLLMPKYKGFTLFGCLDDDVDSWIQAGAAPVAKSAKSKKIYKGLNDNTGSEWEYVVVGKDDGGNAIKCYLLSIEEAEYERLKLAPLRERNENIRQSMGIGVMDNDGQGKVMGNVSGLKTYAPKTTVNGEVVGNGNLGLSTEITHDA